MTTRLGLLIAAVMGVLASTSFVFAAVYKDISEFRHIRHTLRVGGGTTWQASADITKAELQGGNFFKVSTAGGAVDLDFGNDAALDAEDVGSSWKFCVDEGGTNALTVTAGASGVTTVKTIESDGTTCEDVGDCITVTAYSTTQASVFTQCAD